MHVHIYMLLLTYRGHRASIVAEVLYNAKFTTWLAAHTIRLLNLTTSFYTELVIVACIN